MVSESKKIPRTLGLILYLVGAMLAFSLLALSVWGDLEASTFSAMLQSDEGLRTLRCPVLITKNERGVISATFENPTDRDASPLVRSTITAGFVTLVDEQDRRLEIPAGESQDVEWEVSLDNAAYNRLILVRLYQLRNFGVPSRQASCGVVVLPFSGITGRQVFVSSYVISLVLMAGGLYLYAPKNLSAKEMQSNGNRQLRKVIRSFIFLGVYFLVAALITLIGDWLLSTLLMVFAVISVIGVFSFALTSK